MKRFKLKHNALSSTYLFILMPMLVILPLSVFSIIYLNSFYTESIKNQYTVKLESIYKENELTLENISNNIRFLEADDAFVQTMRGNGSDEEVAHSIRQLRKLITSYSIVDSAQIICRNNGKVYSTNGTFDIENFYQNNYSYSSYDGIYWEKYKAPMSEKQILPPTYAGSSKDKQIVVPIVFTRIGKEYTSNLFIINVSMKYMMNNLQNVVTTEESLYGFINKQTFAWFDISGDLDKKIDKTFWKKINAKGSVSFNYPFNGIPSFVIAYSPTVSILGYTYAVVIPESVIRGQTFSFICYIALIWMGIFFVILILTRFSANNLYAPIKGLLSLIRGDVKQDEANKESSEISVIRNYIISAQKTKTTYLPMIQENILVEFLNNPDSDIEETEQLFLENGLDFSYDNFCVVILRLRPTRLYHKTFDNSQHDSIMKGILGTVCEMFPDVCDIYKLPIKSDMLYILLNFDDTVLANDIQRTIDDFASCLEPDKELIHLGIAIGGIYQGMQGLKHSHDDAGRMIEGVAVSPDTLSDSIVLRSHAKSYAFGIENEATLTNYLSVGKVSDARNYINQIVEHNVNSYVSNVAMLNLFTRIAHIIINVMRLKKITLNNQRIDEIDIVSEIFLLPPKELREVIEKMLDAIENNVCISRLNIPEIVAYIQQHFHEPINLDFLADQFKTSPSYLSRILKERLGVPFSEYLNSLRIDKAKVLLEKTDKTVDEISQLTGFSSRVSFTRSFSALLKVTPTQYRKVSKR